MPLRRVADPLLLAGAFLVAPVPAFAQETFGGIQARLRATDGGAIVAAAVTATSPDLLGVRRTTSAPDGVFLLLALPPGRYTLRIAAIGYRPVAYQDVEVQLGKVSGLGDVRLERAAVTLNEMIVTAPKVTLDPMGTNVGGILRREDYDDLPTDRDYKSLITILPHINTSYNGDPANSAGSTGLENLYFIDGVNVTAPYTAGRGTSLPYNFIRSVEVRAGGYEAQYGGALGAIVNAVTYTGSNQFEANFFGFATHEALSFEPRAQPLLRETGAYSYDVGGRVSGPILRDRLWFSLAYNPRVTRAEREITGLGVYPDRSRADVFAGKVTWQPAGRSNLELSLFGDPETHHEVAGDLSFPGLRPLNADPWLRRLERGGVSVSLRGSSEIGRAVLLEGSVSRSSRRESVGPETGAGSPVSNYTDLVEGTVDGRPDQSEAAQRTTGGMVRATIMTGRHRVVIGAEYERSRVSAVTAPSDFILRRSLDQYLLHRESKNSRVHNEAPTAYAQDAWRTTDRLTVNAGLRWSSQRLIATSGETAQHLGHEWQPRVGFSWQIGERASQRFFGSYGRFYQRQPLRLSSVYYGDFVQQDWSYSSDPRQPGAVASDSSDTSIFEVDNAYLRSVPGAHAERFDEFTLGYDHLLGPSTRFTIRGMYRHLGTTFQQGRDESRCPPCWFLGMPGEGDLAFLPKPRRDYTALELELEGSWKRLRYRGSYVLSRAVGNYVGLFGSDLYREDPGIDFGLTMDFQGENSTGLLPNDRTHVLKLTGSYLVADGFTLGGMAAWQSGTPLNEFGTGPFPPVFPKFLVPRGSAGRMIPLWDISLRARYGTRLSRTGSMSVLLDAVYVGNPRRAVRRDQHHYYGENLTQPNPNYLYPTAFQPPMAARLGVEVTF